MNTISVNEGEERSYTFNVGENIDIVIKARSIKEAKNIRTKYKILKDDDIKYKIADLEYKNAMVEFAGYGLLLKGVLNPLSHLNLYELREKKLKCRFGVEDILSIDGSKIVLKESLFLSKSLFD